MEEYVIALDFDGTCVGHAYPQIGPSAGAEPYLRAVVKLGAKLVLWTCRSDEPEKEAVAWFDERGIPLWYVAFNPAQAHFSNSRKLHASLFVDDRSVGMPMKRTGRYSHIDWSVYGAALVETVRTQMGITLDEAAKLYTLPG